MFMAINESDSINKAALRSIVERIVSSEVKHETVRIGFEIIIENGVVRLIEWKSKLSRKYDKLTP